MQAVHDRCNPHTLHDLRIMRAMCCTRDADGHPAHVIRDHAHGVWSMSVSPTRLVSGGMDASALVYDLCTGVEEPLCSC